MNNLELSIVMPCLNESETLAICINKAKKFLFENKVNGEIIIADNGSTDNSQNIAKSNGARVVNVREKGYGNALKGGIKEAKGEFVIMGDADDSYDFYNLGPFLEKLRAGQDLVMGNRFKGGIAKGAMPFLHKYLGNPVLSFLGKLFYDIKVGDFHCGLRGFRKLSYEKMNLKTSGMEFASEMVVKASLKEMNIVEVPTTLSRDGRTRAPHLNTWRDGWRHLKFLMMLSPKWLYYYPGIIMIMMGVILSGVLISFRPSIGGVNFDIHSLLYTSALAIVGVQLIAFYLLSIVNSVSKDIIKIKKSALLWVRYFNLEKGLIIGLSLIAFGLGLFVFSFLAWKGMDFGSLPPTEMMRVTIPSVTFMVLGVQIMIYSFFLHILRSA